MNFLIGSTAKSPKRYSPTEATPWNSLPCRQFAKRRDPPSSITTPILRRRILMDRDSLRKKTVFAAIIIALLLFSTGGLLVLKTFLGYVGVEVPAQAGYITQIIIDDRRQTEFWAGAFGLVFAEGGFTEEQFQTFDPGDLTSVTLVFDCFSQDETTQEIYASTNNSISFSTLRAGTTSMIDDQFINFQEY